MANVFSKAEEQERPVIQIVRDSLDVSADGNVTFRSREGRGSGKAVTIPGGQFDEFVSLMVQTQESREALAEQEREASAAASTTDTDETSDNSEEDSE